MRKYYYIISATLLVLLAVCIFIKISKIIKQNTILKETARRFSNEKYLQQAFRLGKPINYKEKSNKLFPLIIYLHGAGAHGNDNLKQLSGLSSLIRTLYTKHTINNNNFDSFIYVPQCPKGNYWNNSTLRPVIETIEHLSKKYPIDKNRLYLIGFSMGGSGVYSLAESYFNYTQNHFAAIARLSGQSSFSEETHQVISKSSVWLHVGLKDVEIRILKAREAYQKLKTIHNITNEKIDTHNSDQNIITKISFDSKNREIAKITEYSQKGHMITDEVFKNKDFFKWLFNQKGSIVK